MGSLSGMVAAQAAEVTKVAVPKSDSPRLRATPRRLLLAVVEVVVASSEQAEGLTSGEHPERAPSPLLVTPIRPAPPVWTRWDASEGKA